MSLTNFVGRPEVAAKIKPLRPNISRKITVSLKVEPRSNRYMLIGTAFDYLLRFELQRRAPYAIAEHWIAKSAPDLIQRQAEMAAKGRGVIFDSYIPLGEVAERARKIIMESKVVLANYIKSEKTNTNEQAILSAYAIRLAKLDYVFRALYLDPSFEKADPDDVQDLLNMLCIVPFDALLNKEIMILNPNFRESSTLVGGADTDFNYRGSYCRLQNN